MNNKPGFLCHKALSIQQCFILTTLKIILSFYTQTKFLETVKISTIHFGPSILLVDGIRKHVNMLSTLNVKQDEGLLTWILERALPRELAPAGRKFFILTQCQRLADYANLFQKSPLGYIPTN